MAKVRRAQIVWQGDTGQTYTLTLDASVHETHTATSTVTDHPVEKGANISDHIRPDPDQLKIEGVISNTPHFLPVDHVGAVSQVQTQLKGAQVTAGQAVTTVPLAGGLVGLAASGAPLPTALIGKIGIGVYQTAVATGFSGEFDRVTECYKELLRIRAEGQLVRVLTTLRSYDNMALTSLEVTREAKSGNSLQLALEFKVVRFGTTKTEPVPKIPVASKPKGSAVKSETEGSGNDSSLLNLWLNKGR